MIDYLTVVIHEHCQNDDYLWYLKTMMLIETISYTVKKKAPNNKRFDLKYRFTNVSRVYYNVINPYWGL